MGRDCVKTPENFCGLGQRDTRPPIKLERLLASPTYAAIYPECLHSFPPIHSRGSFDTVWVVSGDSVSPQRINMLRSSESRLSATTGHPSLGGECLLLSGEALMAPSLDQVV